MMIRSLFVAFALSVLAPWPALGGATPWQEVAPGARLRLVSADGPATDGMLWFGLELDMAQTTKTYWRTPGESGIPTRLDDAGTRDLAGMAIAWPYPERSDEGGLVDYVYHGPVLLPVSATLTGGDPMLAIAVTMGICDEICVPVRASFDLPVNLESADPAQSLRIRQALASVPVEDAAEAAAIGEMRPAPDGAGVLLAVDSERIDPQSIRLETPDPALVAGSPQKSPIAGHIFVPIFGGSATRLLPDGLFRVTFLGQNGPSETWRALAR